MMSRKVCLMGGMVYYFLKRDRTQVAFVRVPCGLKNTADMLLEFMSKSDGDHLRNIASFVKISKKFHEEKAVSNFVI